jgi:hypothetical protein
MKKNLLPLLFVALFLMVLSSCNKEKTIAASDSNINFFSLNGKESLKKTIILSNGNIAMAGTFNQNGFVAVFDSEGTKLWYSEVGGYESDLFNDLIETSEGDILAVGTANSPSEGVTGFSDAWLVNFSAEGNVNWKTTIGVEAYSEVGLSALETPEGDFVVTGWQTVSGFYSFVGRISKDGNFMWQRSYRIGPWHSWGKSMVLTPEGDLMVAGLCSSGGGGINLDRNTTYLAKFNLKFGDLIDSDIYTDFVREAIYSFTISEGGSLILQNEKDGYSWTTFIEGENLSAKVQYAKVDFNRNLILERKYSGIGHLNLSSTIKLDNGEYLLCGRTSEQPLEATGLKNPLATIIKIGNNGEVKWSSTFGSSASSQSALSARQKDDKWFVYSANRDPETSTKSYAIYKTDNLGNVLK